MHAYCLMYPFIHMLTPSHMLPPHIGTILLTHAPPLPHPPDTRTPPHTRTSLTCNSSHALPSHTHPYSHTHPVLTPTPFSHTHTPLHTHPLLTRVPFQTRNPLTHSPSSHTHHLPPCNAPPSHTSTPSSQTPLLTHTPLSSSPPVLRKLGERTLWLRTECAGGAGGRPLTARVLGHTTCWEALVALWTGGQKAGLQPGTAAHCGGIQWGKGPAGDTRRPPAVCP